MTPKTLLCSQVAWTTEAAAGHSFRGHTHTQADSRDTVHKGAKSGCYWIKPLLTVLEYDGKNLETQGGLCQQALFA